MLWLCVTQGQEVGEPRVKKVKGLLDEDDEGEEGLDESPEEVLYDHAFLFTHILLSSQVVC